MKALSLILALVLLSVGSAHAQTECTNALTNKPELQATTHYLQTLKKYQKQAQDVHRFIGQQVYSGIHRSYADENNPLTDFLAETTTLVNNYEADPETLKIMGDTLAEILSVYTLAPENPNRSIFKITELENPIDQNWENTSTGIWGLLHQFFRQKNHTQETLNITIHLRSSLQNAIEYRWITKGYASEVATAYENSLNHLPASDLQVLFPNYFLNLIPFQNKQSEFQRARVTAYLLKIQSAQVADYDALADLMLSLQTRRGVVNADLARLLIDVMSTCQADEHRKKILLKSFSQLLSRGALSSAEQEQLLDLARNTMNVGP